MAATTRALLKAAYENQDRPQGSDYTNLIDSFISIADTTAQETTSELLAPTVLVGVSGQRGRVVVAEQTTVLSSASGPSGFSSTRVVRIPASSAIVDMMVQVLTSASGNAGGMRVRVGTSANFNAFADILCSAQGQTYRIGGAGNIAAACAANWQNVGANAVQLHIDVTAQTSTTQTDLFNALLTVNWMPK